MVFDGPYPIKAHLLGEDGLLDAVAYDALLPLRARVDDLRLEDHRELHGQFLPQPSLPIAHGNTPPRRAGSSDGERATLAQLGQAAFPSSSALVGTMVPAVTSTCSTFSGWLVDEPRTSRAPSAMPFIPWM